MIPPCTGTNGTIPCRCGATGCPSICDTGYPRINDWLVTGSSSNSYNFIDDALVALGKAIKTPRHHDKFIQQRERAKLKGRPR